MTGYRGELSTGKDRQAPVGPDEVPVSGVVTVPYITPLADEMLTDLGTPAVMAARQEPMGMRFTVIDSFRSDELNSDYVAGLSYEAREGDAVLRALLPRWIEEGKVRAGGPMSTMTGVGQVFTVKTGG